MEYRVEALAAAAGVSVDTIRFYQGRGILPPPRRAGRVVLYDDGHLERLREVKDLQSARFQPRGDRPDPARGARRRGRSIGRGGCGGERGTAARRQRVSGP